LSTLVVTLSLATTPEPIIPRVAHPDLAVAASDPAASLPAAPDVSLAFGPGLTELFRLQAQILRAMSSGESATALAAELCRFVARYAGDRVVSLLRLGPDGAMHPVAVLGAEPAMAADFDGLRPGPTGGSCGAAMHRAAPVFAADAQTDPCWADLRAAARRWGVRSCWSQPVFQGGQPIGTFAITGTTRGLPSPSMRRLLEQAAALAGTILQLDSLQQAQRREAARARRQAGFTTMLAQVNALAAARPEETALYEGICRIAVAEAGLALVWIGAPDADLVFRPSAAAGATGFLDNVHVTANPNQPEGQGLSGTAWRERRIVVRQGFSTANMFAPWLAAARRFGLGAGAALPLMLRGSPRAVLHLYAGEEGVLEPELLALAETLAVDIGRALEAIDQQRHLDRLQALHSALLTEGEVLLQARSEAEILHRTCAHLAASALFHIAWLARPDEAGVLRKLAGAGAGIPRLMEERFALDDDPPALVARAWRERRSLIRDDLDSDPGLARYRPLFVETGWRSAAMMPVWRGGELFAILSLGSPHPNLFKADVLALCERVAQLLGRGLDELDLREAMERERGRQFHLARHDALTGLPNRLMFEEHLGLALARARRHEASLAVCMIDLDDFKPVNDRWGHAAGDWLLREVAARLQGVLRRSDVIARLGGDEFALALEEIGDAEALGALLDRIAEAMAAPFPLPEGAAQIGLSIGAALFPSDGDEPDLLLRRADAALYRTKATKETRGRHWQRWDGGVADPAPTPSPLEDAYGAEARRLLTATAGIWPAVTAGFIDEFYTAVRDWDGITGIFDALSADALARLKTAQAEHLTALMAPATDRETLLRRARAVGRIHALVGVDGGALMQAMALYQSRLSQRLAALPLTPSDRQNLLALAFTRLQHDSAAQMAARADTIAAYFEVILRPPPAPELTWVDALRALLDAVAGLPGIMVAGVLRPDADGRFQVVASSSTGEITFGRIREATGIAPRLDATVPEGQGLIGCCWRSGEAVSAANFQTDPRTASWHAVARRFGAQSGIALPLRDNDDRIVAVLNLIGAWPGQFEIMWMRHFCLGLVQALSRLWQQRRGAAVTVVPETTAAAWRRRLFTGGLRLHYQPLVDLRHGHVYGVEALARLEQEDGTLIPPGRFLPLLGARDLDELFRLGLSESLQQAMAWDDAGLRLRVSLNLPPATLVRPDCAFWVREALARAGIMPERLALEITENQELADPELSAAAIVALGRLGVLLVMDDLGAGFSSLDRLRSLPFSAVKIDQGLIRGVRAAPDRTMHFVGALVRLAHDLEIRSVVEGLETPDLVEAAAILGGHGGQGFALARPMAGNAVAGWVRGFRLELNRDAPRTALGALASLWRTAHLGDGAAVRDPDDCPVGAFLEQRGLAGGQLGEQHRLLHEIAVREGRASARYRAESARFQHALAELARAEASP
jgi:diguanylate cyclase (GGDEF)-like protein